MAKWLAEILKPVVYRYVDLTGKDMFKFGTNTDDFSARCNITNTYMCLFDATSLFTNIPLTKTIHICLNTLYRNPDINEPSLPESLLENLLLKETTEVEFMRCWCDG